MITLQQGYYVIDHPDDFAPWEVREATERNGHAMQVRMQRPLPFGRREQLIAYCSKDVWRVAKETGVVPRQLPA